MSETEVTTEGQSADTDDLDAFSNDFFGQKSAEPSETKEEVEQDESETEEGGTEAQTDEDALDEAEVQEEILDKPKRKTVQDRIDEVVKQREDIKREAQASLDALRKEFEDKLAALQPKREQNQESAEPTPDAVKEDGEPVYPLGEFDPQYIRDLTRFTLATERAKAQVEAAEQQRVNAQTQAAQALQTEWNQRVETAKTEYPDLVEKGQELLNSFNDLPTDYASYLSTVLMSMDKGPDVLYYLSNHPDEAHSIVNSGAQKATLALGRIEARFLESEQTAAKPKVTKAPPPPTERSRGTNGAFISVAPDTDDLRAFEAEFFRRK